MTAVITNLALIHLPFHPSKPTGRMGCARLHWPRFFTDMETIIKSFDLFEKPKELEEWYTNWQQIP